MHLFQQKVVLFSKSSTLIYANSTPITVGWLQFKVKL